MAPAPAVSSNLKIFEAAEVDSDRVEDLEDAFALGSGEARLEESLKTGGKPAALEFEARKFDAASAGLPRTCSVGMYGRKS